MFSVSYLGTDKSKSIRPILSGVSFGFFGDKHLYRVIADSDSNNPLSVEIVIAIDDSRKDYELVASEIVDNTWNITLYNPSRGFPSGCTFPIGIESESLILAVMFMVDSYPDSPSYRLSYEFYEGNRNE